MSAFTNAFAMTELHFKHSGVNKMYYMDIVLTEKLPLFRYVAAIAI